MGRVAHLHVLDVASGRIPDLFEGTRLRADARRARRELLRHLARRPAHRLRATTRSAEKHLDNCKALAELDAAQRAASRRVARDKAWDFEAPRYSPDGTRIAFVAAHQGKKHTMPGQLARAASAAARWRVLSAAWDHAVHAPLRWADDGQTRALHRRGPRAAATCGASSCAARSATRAVAAAAGCSGFDVAGDVVVTRRRRDATTRRACTRSATARRRARLERFNDELLARAAPRRARGRAASRARSGDAGADVARLPARLRRASKKYPVLHTIHGGPHAAAGDTFHYRWNTQVFAAQGYVVACVNYHGSSGFGYDFLDSITHRWGELELQDVEAATDWLLKKPWADRKRVFATGGSYGGYMVAWMNGHVKPGRYQAYVCHAGCFDWAAMFADDAYTWHAKELGAWYWDDMAKVHAQSPHAFAGTMKTPTLVIHGALDYRVPDAQGLAYYNTLKARGVDARLLWFPDENHWILKPRNSQALVRRVLRLAEAPRPGAQAPAAAEPQRTTDTTRGARQQRLDLDAVAPRRLGAVERRVGACQQRGQHRRPRRPIATARRDSVSGRPRSCQRGGRAWARSRSRSATSWACGQRGAGQQHDELLAAPAADAVDVAHLRRQQRAQVLQRAVAGGMALHGR